MFAEALTTSEQAGPDDYIQPNLGHALRIWWAFYWRNALISGFLSIILHYAVRWTYENTNLHVRYLRPISQLSDYLLSYIVAIFIIHFVLKKNFRHFRIALLSGYGGPGAEILQPTFGRTIRVWWTYVWRTIILSILGWVFVIYPLGIFVGLFNPSPTIAVVFFGAVGFVVGGAVALFVIYSNILDEDFGDFRVSLLPREAKPAVTPVIETKPVELP